MQHNCERKKSENVSNLSKILKRFSYVEHMKFSIIWPSTWVWFKQRNNPSTFDAATSCILVDWVSTPFVFNIIQKFLLKCVYYIWFECRTKWENKKCSTAKNWALWTNSVPMNTQWMILTQYEWTKCIHNQKYGWKHLIVDFHSCKLHNHYCGHALIPRKKNPTWFYVISMQRIKMWSENWLLKWEWNSVPGTQCAPFFNGKNE